jgi:hypothetical protein
LEPCSWVPSSRLRLSWFCQRTSDCSTRHSIEVEQKQLGFWFDAAACTRYVAF